MLKMFGRVILLIFINILSFSLALSINETLIDCTPANFSSDVSLSNVNSLIVNVTYKRDSLALYLYPRTFSVNMFISDSLISVKILGNTNDPSLGFINHEKQYTTEVAGIANFDDISKYKVGLQDCQFFVSDKATGRFFDKLESTIYHMTEHCLADKLCKSLGNIRYPDVARAKQSPRDFGTLSIWSKTLQTRFPKMISPKLTNMSDDKPKKQAKLVEVADSIVRSIADGYRNSSNGTIDVADAKHGIYFASKGTFSGLDNLVRAENYTVKVSPSAENSKVFSFTFGLLKGSLVYKDYRAFNFVPLVGSLHANVSNVLFNAVVTMDFSQRHCRAYLQNFTVANAGTSRTYTRGGLSFLMNPLVRSFTNIWDSQILVAIENRLRLAMSAFLQDKFDCENFRP